MLKIKIEKLLAHKVKIKQEPQLPVLAKVRQTKAKYFMADIATTPSKNSKFLLSSKQWNGVAIYPT